jgi:radical SAM protein with 4Fe4S-binding SPASM domain
MLNLLNVEASILLGKTKGVGYPYLLTIEPTNFCNLKCPLCKTGAGKIKREKKLLKFEEAKKIIDEIGKYVYIVNLYNWGEPLLNEEIFKIIKYLHKKNIYVSVNTNGNYPLNLNQKIIDSELDGITFALDGSTKEVYEEYRIKGSFDQVIKNIKDLAEKKKKKPKTPFIEIQFLVFNHNKKDIENIKKLSEELGADGLIIRAAFAPDNKKNRQDYYTWDSKKGFCRRFWYCATINCDGSIVPCCNFFKEKDDLGNVLLHGFKKEWDNEEYQKAREAIIKNKMLPDACKQCKKYSSE